jgi:hypothetical protein
MQPFTKTAWIIALGLTAVGARATIDDNQGRTTAVLQKKAARFAAQEDYLVQRALCLNDGQVAQEECFADAHDSLAEALDLVDEQYAARLAVLDLIGSGRYDPQIVANQFSPDITNNLFPLVPGRTLSYQTVTPKGIEHVEYQETNVTRMINGILCRQVHDVGSFNGEVTEDTLDWFAQQDNGDVWYMGEFSEEVKDGFVENIDGSWRYGTDGAKPGIQMRAHPTVGDVYRQEYALSEAEDMARTVALDQTITVPAGVFMHCLVSDEWSPVDGDAGPVERKYFAPGVGLVLTIDLETGAREELIAIQN